MYQLTFGKLYLENFKHETKIETICYQDVVYKVMNNPTNGNDRPIAEVKIADSKVFQVDEPFVVAKEGATR